MKHFLSRQCIAPAALAISVAALLAACSSSGLFGRGQESTGRPDLSQAERSAAAAAATRSGPVRSSNASSPRAYRQDAATHLYGLNHERIYKGRLPPMLYAVGVLQVDLDSRGNVRDLKWMRAPKHAPEVVAEIERTVRAAAPFPAPARMGKVVYTDTWLWDKSGRFQLDTLTEGQD